MIDIPLCESLILIKDSAKFYCSNFFISYEARNLLNSGMTLAGWKGIQYNAYDMIPTLVWHYGEEPHLFRERGVYLEENPIPHLVNPIKLLIPAKQNPCMPVWIYNIYFL